MTFKNLKKCFPELENYESLHNELVELTGKDDDAISDKARIAELTEALTEIYKELAKPYFDFDKIEGNGLIKNFATGFFTQVTGINSDDANELIEGFIGGVLGESEDAKEAAYELMYGMARNGDLEAMYIIGTATLRIGGKEHYAEGYSWIKKSAELGYNDAVKFLATNPPKKELTVNRFKIIAVVGAFLGAFYILHGTIVNWESPEELAYWGQTVLLRNLLVVVGLVVATIYGGSVLAILRATKSCLLLFWRIIICGYDDHYDDVIEIPVVGVIVEVLIAIATGLKDFSRNFWIVGFLVYSFAGLFAGYFIAIAVWLIKVILSPIATIMHYLKLKRNETATENEQPPKDTEVNVDKIKARAKHNKDLLAVLWLGSHYANLE